MNSIVLNMARLTVMVVGFCAAIPSFAKVKSVSLERTFVGENIRVLEVEVSCRAVKQERRLRKVVSENGPWCSVDLPDMCATRKYTLAREVCDLTADEFKALVANKEGDASSSPAPSKSTQKLASDAASPQSDDAENLLQEKMLIEEQRIQLEQKRLELRKKELALQKQLSE